MRHIWAALFAALAAMVGLPVRTGDDANGGAHTVGRQNAEHYTWGAGADGWYLAKRPGLHVIEERIPPGVGETLHRHQHAFQFFYVLCGTARFTVGEKTVTVSAGEGLPMEPGVAHRVENPGKQDLTLLVVSQPPSHGDREEVR